MKPLIGITSYFVEAAEQGKQHIRGSYDQDYFMTSADYVASIESAGGIAVILPCTQDPKVISAYVNRVDGILFTGGEDIHPNYYGQAIKRGLEGCSPVRDAFEMALLKVALESDKAILGVCRGLQLINIFYGGTLFQDLKQMAFTDIEHSCNNLPKYMPCHEVEVYVNTHLYNMVKKAKLFVNTKHHQSIDDLGDGLVISAKAIDGVIEGIEDPNQSFLAAVQWHPEMMSGQDELQRMIFEGFIKACRK